MGPRFTFACRFVLVLCLAGASARASAAGASAKADGLVNQAVELRRRGDDQGALNLLQQAYGMGHAPRAAGQLGLCEQALGQWADAETHLLEALKADQDAWVKKSQRVLEDALVVVKSHIARVEVQGDPEGAEVLINGVIVGKLPLAAAVRVAAGETEIELRAPGYAREVKTLRLEAGQYQRVVLHASRPTATPVPPPPVQPAPVPVNVTVTTAPAPAAAPDQNAPAAVASTAPASSARGVYKWVAFGLGAAGLGVGAYGWTKNIDDSNAFDKAGCGLDPQGRPVKMTTGMADSVCTSKKSGYETGTLMAVGGFVAAGVLVGAGLALWLTEPETGSRATALACAPALGAGLEPGIGCAVRF